MEENKKLVISYYYHVEKEDPEEEEVHKKIDELWAQLPKNVTGEGLDETLREYGEYGARFAEELAELMIKNLALSRKKDVKVFKEYPEFLVKDFKTKEELYDFLDEDEPNIHLEDDITFESVPECLKKIGISETYEESLACRDYLYEKHSEERK